MWIMHKGKRDEIVNMEKCTFIYQQHNLIFLDGAENVSVAGLQFEDEKEAKQAWGYMLEALKRGDALVHL